MYTGQLYLLTLGAGARQTEDEKLWTHGFTSVVGSMFAESELLHRP